jgi:hypothetical protein
MGKPLSWRWKLTIGTIIFLMVSMAMIFSPFGQNWLLGRIDSSYNELPASERRTSELADSYLSLAWFRSSICLDSKAGMDMYKQFCGMSPNKDGGTVFINGKLGGKYCDEEGKTGWGPCHPRAPEAYFSYLELLETEVSSQVFVEACCNYSMLFGYWMQNIGPERKIHPMFNKYWPKIKNKIVPLMRYMPSGFDINATGAPPYEEPKEK